MRALWRAKPNTDRRRIAQFDDTTDVPLAEEPNSTIAHNTFIDGRSGDIETAVVLRGNSNNNVVTNNTVLALFEQYNGLSIGGSNNTVSDNVVVGGRKVGITLSGSNLR